MRNLEVLELVHKSVSDPFSEVSAFTQTANEIYFIRNSLYKHDIANNLSVEVCPHFFDNVITVKVLTIEGKVCVVTDEHLHIIDPNDNGIQSIKFEEKIEAIAWNPTEELVALVTPDGDVATFSVDYENAEVFPQGRSSLEERIPDTVYVGWGSEDTQFKGSEGKLKPNRAPVEAESVQDQKSRISWRGNGEMFVVNYWKDQQRVFVVFETPCKATYRSEECLGLQPQIAWRPAGNMIAALTEVAKRQSVVIFEKNGQKRFSFDLDFDETKIKELRWSPCAKILTIYSHNSSDKSQNIHLLMSSNYKWYEKQTLTFKADNPLLNFEWLETTQFTFTLRAITQHEIIDYIFLSTINNSSAVCAVIDGKYLHLTDFNDAILPPVMSAKKITNDRPINFVFWVDDSVAIVDSDNNLKTFNTNTLEVAFCMNLGEALADLPSFPLACHHFLTRAENLEIYFAAETESDTVLYSLHPQNRDVNSIDAATTSVRQFLSVAGNPQVSCLTRVGATLYINEPSPTYTQQSVKIFNDKSYVCRLTPHCHFYVNGQKISDSVDSFVIFEDYLLYTTKFNHLYCARFGEEFNSERAYRRNIEQGAVIVAAIPNSPKIVLQLPRGNLETISCRLISIDILDRLLNAQEWDQALRFIRLEKLNANLMFDLNSNRFLENVDKFIEAVKTINELNSICLEFENGNVLNTIYKNWGKSDSFPEKISTIFGKLFEYFDRVDYAPYITTIVAINFNFFSLREALVYLQDLLKRCNEDFSLKDRLTDAVNTLKTYGCDQEKLYSEALLLYDLELSHFLASRCQLDPRIYDGQLNNLKNLTEVERRYEINLFAKKPKVAIAYLMRCPEVDSEQITTFIKTHKLARDAYESCPTSSRHYQCVSKAFAEELQKKYHHHEAGVVLKRANLLEEALEEFKLGFCWREVLDLLEELKVDEIEKLRVVNEQAKGLSQRLQSEDAAMLYEFYANNYERAVKIFIDNHLFEDAIHTARKYKRRDIIVSEIIPLLCKQKTYLTQTLKNLQDTYNKYVTRLATVRSSKVARFQNLNYDGDDPDNDLFSDGGTIITRSSKSTRSRSSRASSRNRWKEERKKMNLREGGIYEDIALIRSLHWTIKDIYSKGRNIGTYCTLLLQESDISYKEIKLLHDLYWTIMDNVKKTVDQIWPPHFYKIPQTQTIQERADLENYEHLDVEFRAPPKDTLFNRKLDFFKEK